MRTITVGALAVALLQVVPDGAAQGPPRTLVAVFAHGDDETSVGPILARYAREGAQVHLVIVTDGAQGGLNTAIARGPDLARARAEEARCATDALGARPPILLGYPDGKLGDYGTDPALLFRLTARLHEELQRLRPDALITWGPDGAVGHPDHRLVSTLVTQLVRAGAPGVPERVFHAYLPAEGIKVINPARGVPPLSSHRPSTSTCTCRSRPPTVPRPCARWAATARSTRRRSCAASPRQARRCGKASSASSRCRRRWPAMIFSRGSDTGRPKRRGRRPMPAVTAHTSQPIDTGACHRMAVASASGLALLIVVPSAQPGAVPSAPQMSMQVPVPPAIVPMDGQRWLIYELHLENSGAAATTLTSVEVADAATPSDPLAVFEGNELVRRLDVAPDRQAPLSIPAGSRRVVYIEVVLRAATPPNHLRHLVQFASVSSTIVGGVVGGIPGLRVDDTAPVALGPPLAGGPWVAVHHPDWERGHRRVFYTRRRPDAAAGPLHDRLRAARRRRENVTRRRRPRRQLARLRRRGAGRRRRRRRGDARLASGSEPRLRPSQAPAGRGRGQLRVARPRRRPLRRLRAPEAGHHPASGPASGCDAARSSPSSASPATRPARTCTCTSAMRQRRSAPKACRSCSTDSKCWVAIRTLRRWARLGGAPKAPAAARTNVQPRMPS